MQNKKIFDALIEDASYTDLVEMRKITLEKLVEKDSEVEIYHSSIKSKYSDLAIKVDCIKRNNANAVYKLQVK